MNGSSGTVSAPEGTARTDGRREDAGYRAAYAVAEDNLRADLTVVADCVNPLSITREAWRDVARRTGVPIVEVEVVCVDTAEHRRRVETRSTDFPGWTLTWQEVVDREYHPWDCDRIVLDTSRQVPAEHVAELLNRIRGHAQAPGTGHLEGA